MSKNAKNIFLSLMVMIVMMPIFVFAQSSGGGGNPSATGNTGNTISQVITIKNPFKQNSIQGLIETIVNDILIPIGGVIAVMMIMYAGFMYVTAGGDPGKIKKAHDALLWAVIGAAILLGAWVISQAISTTINQLKTT